MKQIFLLLLFPFKKFWLDGLNVVKPRGIVCSVLSSTIRNDCREMPETHTFLTSPFFPLTPGYSHGGIWVGVGKPLSAEKLPLKSSEPKARSQNQRLPCFLECITGYCPHQTKPFHQGFFKTLFFPPLFCFEISWATINFRERERER